jgi:hypothetical protein
MEASMRRLCVYVMTGLLALQAGGCGTLIYPERHGQKTGQIDPGVALLDAAGLLVFLVPGLVAFGVDFATGAIYLPGGSAALNAADDVRVVTAEPADLSIDSLELLLAEASDGTVHLDDPRLEVYRVHSEPELRRHLRQL